VTQTRNGLRVNGAHRTTTESVMTPGIVEGAPDTRHVARVVRVSTDAQDTERQVRSVTELAERHFPDLPTVDYYDDGTSAYHVPIFNRPRGKELIAAIERGQVAAIVTDAQDRLSRGELVEWAIFAQLCREARTRIVTAHQGELRLDDFSGELTGALTALIARKESADKSHRITSGKATKAQAGLWHHGRLSPGYRFDKETGRLEVTADLPVIAELFRHFNDGETFELLCEYANSTLSTEALAQLKDGVTPIRVRKWLSNPMYVGKIRHRDRLYDGQHKPAVDAPTFERAQRKLAMNRAKHARPARSWPFSGIAQCGRCGGPLWLNPVPQRTGGTYRYFVCRDRECQKKHRRDNAAAAEANIVLALAAAAIEADKILREDTAFAVPTDYGPTLEEAQQAADHAIERVKRLGKLIAQDALDEDDPVYLDALRARDTAERIRDRIAGAARSYREELGLLVENVVGLAELAPDDGITGPIEEAVMMIDGNQERTFTYRHDGDGPSLLRVLDGWKAASFEQRRAVIASALESVTVQPEGVELELRAVPQPVTIDAAVPSAGRHAGIRALEADGYGATTDRFGETEPQQ
jgi:DNA invertase Pin-like site-specific DNA recombinase